MKKKLNQEKSHWMVLATVMLGTMLIGLDRTVVSLGLPKMINDFVKEYKTIPEDQRPKVLFVVDSLGMLLTPTDVNTLQKKTFFGKEKKSLAYIIGTMNMILHGIDAPNIVHTNTLGENIADIQEKNRFDIVLANPPFGGKERTEVQQNFPIKTGETAYLFLQHFMKILRAGGSAGIVIKNTFLSNSDNASVAIRKELLESHNLHTILDCPAGTFQGAGVKTVVLFFNKGEQTKKIWYYQLKPGRNMGKTNPLNEKDLDEFIELQKKFKDSDLSWSVDVSMVNQETWDLSVKNPNGNDAVIHRSPAEIIAEIAALDNENQAILQRIRGLL